MQARQVQRELGTGGYTMSKEKQIEIKSITYEEERLYFFVDQVSLAQKKYDRLYKTFKDAPYLSEGARFLSDAGRELQFYKDIVEILDEGYRKQSEWISVNERLPDTTEKILVYCSNGEILPAKYIRVQGLEFWFEETYSCHNITHWMPLPEAPKKGGAE
jgi:hypothetical protein